LSFAKKNMWMEKSVPLAASVVPQGRRAGEWELKVNRSWFGFDPTGSRGAKFELLGGGKKT